MGKQIPIVDYLVLDDGGPYLECSVCESCGARYFDRRNACGRCGAVGFDRDQLANTGSIRSFTIVQRAAKGVPAPFVSATIELDDGALVKANIVDVEPVPENIELGMPVELTTFVAGTDDEDTEAIAFGYRPISA